MLRIRLIEEKIAEFYPEQEMRCPVHLCIGQEAIAAGVCVNLKKEDLGLSNHRAHGHYLAKGGDLKRMLAEIYGKETGCSKGRGGSMHLIDLSVNFLGSTPIVGSTIPIATGVAFAEQLNERKNTVVVFIGDAALEEGVFHESLNFAALKKLPIIYVCENNLYSVYTHLKDRQPERPLHKIAQGHGVHVLVGDGNNVMEVDHLTQKAQEFIQKNDGPVFMEFSTYRWREHCGPNFDNDIGYRSQEEFLEWKEKCPIQQFQKKLLSENFLDKEEIAIFEKEILQEVREAFVFAKESAFPSRRVTEKDVYE